MNTDKYLKVVARLKRRYTKNGVLPVQFGRAPAPYKIYENLAFNKYMGEPC